MTKNSASKKTPNTARKKTPNTARKKTQRSQVVGWREWALLPTLAQSTVVKVKIDTGATTSAIHAEKLQVVYGEDGQAYASFLLHPTNEEEERVEVERHPVVAFRFVKSSSGHGSYRPVIRAPLAMGDQTFDIDLTLTGRDQMGFRMLVGRAALRGRFHVDPSGSFLLGEPTPVFAEIHGPAHPRDAVVRSEPEPDGTDKMPGAPTISE